MFSSLSDPDLISSQSHSRPKISILIFFPSFSHFPLLPQKCLLIFFFTPHLSVFSPLPPIIPCLGKWSLFFLVACVKSFLSSPFFSQQPYAPPPHPMAPPSPSTNSCSQGGAEQLSKTNLYIRGLPPGTTDQDLIKLCQPWVLGTITVKYRGSSVTFANASMGCTWPWCASNGCMYLEVRGVQYACIYFSSSQL